MAAPPAASQGAKSPRNFGGFRTEPNTSQGLGFRVIPEDTLNHTLDPCIFTGDFPNSEALGRLDFRKARDNLLQPRHLRASSLCDGASLLRGVYPRKSYSRDLDLGNCSE